MNVNWIKDNWFKLGIIIAIFAVAYSIYGGGISKSQTKSDAETLRLSIQCREDGQAKLEEDKATSVQQQYKSDVVKCFFEEPEYIFSKELNTCVYLGGYSCDLTKKYPAGEVFAGSPVKRWYKHIVDVYTNKTIEYVYVDDSSNVSDLTMSFIQDFNAKARELGFSY